MAAALWNTRENRAPRVFVAEKTAEKESRGWIVNSAAPVPSVVVVRVGDANDFEPLPERIDHLVPFAAQAPFGEWSDPRQQDGCEEAATIMAYHWYTGTSLTKSVMRDTLFSLTDWEREYFGFFEDTSVRDTTVLLSEYFDIQSFRIVNNPDVGILKKELARGSIILAPMDGQALGNPNFVPPGPERHMVLVRGYDDRSKEFITNDPGTRLGEGFRYPYDRFLTAIRDYPSGNHKPFPDHMPEPAVIILFRSGR